MKQESQSEKLKLCTAGQSQGEVGVNVSSSFSEMVFYLLVY